MTTTARQVNTSNRWGKNKRTYEIGGESYPSVTSILGVIGKPALINWAAKVEREACISAAWDIYNARQSAPWTSLEGFQEHFTLRLGKEKAHARQMAQAADIGSEAHAWIEWSLKRDLGLDPGEEPLLSDGALVATMAFQDWQKEANLSPIFTERIVYSKKEKYAGTADWAGEISWQGERIQVLGDFKTGKAIYSEAKLQNAAYTHALTEMGEASGRIAGLILRLPKTIDDPTFEAVLIPPEDQRGLFKAFLAAKDLHEWIESEAKP